MIKGGGQPKKLPNRKAVRITAGGGSSAGLDFGVSRWLQNENISHYGGGGERNSGRGNKHYFIVTLFYKMKRIAEAVLRWAFFSLNLFMLALYITQN